MENLFEVSGENIEYECEREGALHQNITSIISFLDSPCIKCEGQEENTPSQILQGVIAYVEARSDNENRSAAVKQELCHLGATVVDKFTNEVTHLIYKDGKKASYERALKRNIHIVSVLWVDSCKRSKKRECEDGFPISSAPLQGTPVVLARLKKNKSMQPKDFEEEVANSSDRGEKRRKRRANADRWKAIETPVTPQQYRLPHFFVAETQPMSSPESHCDSPNVIVPDTPPSMRQKMLHLCRQRMLHQQSSGSKPNMTDSIQESPIKSQQPPSLYRRLFANSNSPMLRDSPDEGASEGSASQDVDKVCQMSPSTPEEGSGRESPVAVPLADFSSPRFTSDTKTRKRESFIASVGDTRPSGSSSGITSPLKANHRERDSGSAPLVPEAARHDNPSETVDGQVARVGSVSNMVKPRGGGKRRLLRIGEEPCEALLQPTRGHGGPKKPGLLDVDERKKSGGRGSKRKCSDGSPVGNGRGPDKEGEECQHKKRVRTGESDAGAAVKPDKPTSRRRHSVPTTPRDMGHTMPGHRPFKKSKGGGLAVTELCDVKGNPDRETAEAQTGSTSRRRHSIITTTSAPSKAVEIGTKPVSKRRSIRVNDDAPTISGVQIETPTGSPAPCPSLPVSTCGTPTQRRGSALAKVREVTSQLPADKAIDAPTGSTHRRRSVRFNGAERPEKDAHVTSFACASPVSSVSTPRRRSLRVNPVDVPSAVPPEPHQPSAPISPSAVTATRVVAGTPPRLDQPEPEASNTDLSSTTFSFIQNTSLSRLIRTRRSVEEFVTTPSGGSKNKADRSGATERDVPNKTASSDVQDRAGTLASRRSRPTSGSSAAGDGNSSSKNRKDESSRKKSRSSMTSDSVDRPSIAMTSLHFDEQDIVRAVAKKLGGFSLHEQVTKGTTHLVCGGNRRTINVLMAIARGCWIVSLEWVCKSLELGRWIEEEPYEQVDYFPASQVRRLQRIVGGDSDQGDLFTAEGLIYVADNTAPPQRPLSELLKLYGGQVTSSWRKASLCIGSILRSDVRQVAEAWVLDCITAHERLPLDRYLLDCIGS